MRNLVVLVASMLVLSVTACAGKTIGDGDGKNPKWTGTIKYSLDYELPEAYESQRAMLATEMTCHIGKEFTRVEQASTIGDQITINDLKTGVTTVLLDLMGNKIAITTEDVEDDATKPEIEYLDETKDIVGFKCKKAIYKIKKEDTEAEFEVYYTDELPAAANTQFKGIEGFPLEYVLEAQGMVTTYTAIAVTEGKVDKALSEIPKGYEEMTIDEFMKMMGGE